jgi:hypothetical protein
MPMTAPAIYYVAIGFAIGAVVLFILWLVLCPQICGWWYLMIGEVLLGVGWVAMYFWLCCGWIGWVGLAGTLAGLALLGVYKATCNPTWCWLAKDVAIMFAGVVLPAIGYILVFPPARACAFTWIGAILSTIVALLSIYAVACDETMGP